MQPGTCLAGKQKCPANPHCANGIELIRIIEDLCFKRFGNLVTAVPVRFYTMGNFIYICWLKIEFCQDIPGKLCTFLRGD